MTFPLVRERLSENPVIRAAAILSGGVTGWLLGELPARWLARWRQSQRGEGRSR
jgi:membrane protein YqaA with SNARE-associated domain